MTNVSTNLAPKLLVFAENDVKNLSNHKVSKISFAASLRSSAKLKMSLRFLYAHPFFHGIKTNQEAEAIRKASAEESGNPDVHIWFLLETENIIGPAGRHFRPMILGPVVDDSFYELTNLVPTYQFVEFLDEPMPDEVISCQVMACRVLTPKNILSKMSTSTRHMVQRRNPHDLAQLARATIFDNLNKCNCSSRRNCCDRLLSLEIDQLEIPVSEKLMMKKLIPEAQTFRSFPGNNN